MGHLSRIMTLSLSLCICFISFAQTGSVRMRLEDAKTGEAVGYATVSLNIPVVTKVEHGEGEEGKSGKKSDEADTTIVLKPYKYVLSTGDGLAEIREVKAGSYVLKVEMVGYRDLERSVEVGNGAVNLGVLKISEDVEVLNAARVTEQGNPVIVKKDTVEYLATSYKTADHDMLEDLLRKLPGVEVGSDGSVNANGERVTKITINGKPFFLDDPTIATKNLPAKYFEKVKVVEKMSDQAIFTGIDDGYRETVIDLVVKPGVMDNVSGTITGAGGHDIPAGKDDAFGDGHFRFRGSAMVKRFTDLSQLSLIGNGNNMNNGTRVNWTAGLNGSFTLLDGNMDLSSPYSYKGSQTNRETSSRKTTFLDDGSNLIYNNDGTSRVNTSRHTIGMKLEHKFNKKTSLIFEPKFNFGYGNTGSYSNYTTYTDPCTGEPRSWTNEGFRENMGWSHNWSARGSLLLRQRLDRPGRTISVNFVYSFYESASHGYKQTLTETMAEDDGSDDFQEGEHDETILNQRYVTHSNSNSVYTRVVYTEPIAPKFYYEVNASYSWSSASSNKDVYDSPSDDMTADADGNRHLTYVHDGETWNDPYSYSVSREVNAFTVGTNLRYQRDSLRAQLGVVLRPYFIGEEIEGEIYGNNLWKVFPQAMFSYDFNAHSNFRFTYSGSVSQVSLSRLAPVANNSNPLNVSFGNPYLEPYFTHKFMGKYVYSDKETSTSVQVRWYGNLVQNRVTRATWYDSNGAQYSVPLNEALSGNTNLRVLVNSPLAPHSDFSVSSTTYFRYSNTMSYLGITEGDEGDYLIDKYYNAGEGIWDYKQFQEDFFGADKVEDLYEFFNDFKTETLNFTERLRFKYICDLVEVYLGGRTVMSKSWYSISSYNNPAHWSNYIDTSMTWTIPRSKGFWVNASCSYHWYAGYSTRQSDRVILNMGVSKRLFSQKFTVALRGYDLLNQSARSRVIDAQNYHSVVRSNTFSRYIVLFLTWRFGDNDKK